MRITEGLLRSVIRSALLEADAGGRDAIMRAQLLNIPKQVKRESAEWYEKNWEWSQADDLHKKIRPGSKRPWHKLKAGQFKEEDTFLYAYKDMYDKSFFRFSDAVKIIDKAKSLIRDSHHFSNIFDDAEKEIKNIDKWDAHRDEWDRHVTSVIVNLYFNKAEWGFDDSTERPAPGIAPPKDLDNNFWWYSVDYKALQIGHKDYDQSIEQTFDRRYRDLFIMKNFVNRYYEFKDGARSDKDTIGVQLMLPDDIISKSDPNKHGESGKFVNMLAQLSMMLIGKKPHREYGSRLIKNLNFKKNKIAGDSIKSDQETKIRKSVGASEKNKSKKDPENMYTMFRNQSVAKGFIDDTYDDYLGEHEINHRVEELTNELEKRKKAKDRNSFFYGFDSNDYANAKKLAYQINFVKMLRYLNSLGLDEGFYDESQDHDSIHGDDNISEGLLRRMIRSSIK